MRIPPTINGSVVYPDLSWQLPPPMVSSAFLPSHRDDTATDDSWPLTFHLDHINHKSHVNTWFIFESGCPQKHKVSWVMNILYQRTLTWNFIEKKNKQSQLCCQSRYMWLSCPTCLLVSSVMPCKQKQDNILCCLIELPASLFLLPTPLYKSIPYCELLFSQFLHPPR